MNDSVIDIVECTDSNQLCREALLYNKPLTDNQVGHLLLLLNAADAIADLNSDDPTRLSLHALDIKVESRHQSRLLY
jgi:hypothetical protein